MPPIHNLEAIFRLPKEKELIHILLSSYMSKFHLGLLNLLLEDGLESDCISGEFADALT